MNYNLPSAPHTDFVLYQSDDKQTRIEVRLWNESVWLTQMQMAELFQSSKQNIGQHVKNIFEEQELKPEAVVKEFFTTASDGKSYKTLHYNLDIIISVGYRVRSHRGTQFRIWATQRLREYIVKGFTLDDERLKEGGTNVYFDELLVRIREIRASEKNFYRKVQDIYTTSIDYDANAAVTQEFFATVQNKLHWAAAGRTAAEIISRRADASKPNMGLTSWKGSRVRREDIGIAKNYLQKEEIEILNLLVTQYLDFAELQARSRKPMHMRDWILKLDEFLKLNDREVLKHAGKISTRMAEELAEKEFIKFEAKTLAEDTADLHPDIVDLMKEIPQSPKKRLAAPKKREKPTKR